MEAKKKTVSKKSKIGSMVYTAIIEEDVWHQDGE
jgi:hypothetical protein